MDQTTMFGFARGITHLRFPDGGTRDYSGETSYSALLRKPDKPIINPKAHDGFRKPSSYRVTQLAGTIGRLRQNYYPVVATLSGGGIQPGGWEYFISGESAVELSVGAMPNHSNELRMKLLNNVRKEVLDVAMVLAEISGTAQTLSNNLLRLGRSLEQVSLRKPASFYYLLNGRLKDGRRPTDKFLRETSSVFLEWKYGIMPTVYDIQGATKSLDMVEDGSFWENPPLLVGRARVRATSPFTRTVNSSVAGNPGGVNSGSPRQAVIVEGTVTTEHKARIDYSVSGEGLRGLNRYGIGLSSIATVAYDKTPFSFVFNMAVPIAELIKAWTALAGVTTRGYCETQYRQVNITGGTNVVSKGGINVITTVKPHEFPPEFIRTAFNQVPMPQVHVRNPVKLSNIQTVLALFTQLRRPS